jgi:imidazole glycerol-phosphate synthase subunit HisH
VTQETDPRAPGPAGRLRLAILDYGMGNLRSVYKALEHVGARPELTNDHTRVRQARGIVLQGVGAMPKAMEHVRRLGLHELLRERVEAGVPLIGLCMGMQLLFESTTELGGAEGIGLLEGRVEGLEAPGLRVPQIGWNPVSWTRGSVLNEGLPDPCAFYHANSFAPRPAREDDVLGTAEYGTRFVSVVARETSPAPIFGLQSHPEKSGPHGVALLGNFVRACARVTA